jgi:hypothetical protein
MPGISRAEGAINLLRVLLFLCVLRVKDAVDAFHTADIDHHGAEA